jgi:hypothetical protein
MRLQTFLIPVAALVAIASASAQVPVSIPIVNPLFVEDQLACSPGRNCDSSSVTGWLVGPGTGVFKTSTAQFQIAPAGGLYVAFLGGPSVTGSILQTLGATLQANVTYTLKVTVGARADEPFTGYEAVLLAGNVIVAAGNKATPVGGGFATEVLTYSSGATPAQLGKPLQIFVKSLGTGQVDVSAVTLTYE